jgi:hypothetical protein
VENLKEKYHVRNLGVNGDIKEVLTEIVCDWFLLAQD